MLLSESKNFVLDKVLEKLQEEETKEKFGIQGVTRNGTDIMVIFSENKEEKEMDDISQNISNELLLFLSKFVREEIANLPLLRFSNLNPKTLKIEI